MDGVERETRGEVEVRSLTGESIRVPLEHNITVRDLKLFLKQSFSPASSSPNFHLFHQGVKLGLQTPITGSFFRGEEFLVLVPFVKKGGEQSRNAEPSQAPFGNLKSNEALETTLADSAWSDLMKDLSSLQESSDCENAFEVGLKSLNRAASPTVVKSKSKKESHSSNALLSILLPSSSEVLDVHTIEKLIGLMDSCSCLRNPVTGRCIMSEANDLRVSESDPCMSTICSCPPWLKATLWTFSFVNVYCVCLHLWQKKVTAGTLKAAMDKFSSLEFHPGFVDLKLLSEVFPEVICVVDDEQDATALNGALVIAKFSAGKDDQDEEELITENRLSRSKIISSMRKRERSFNAILSKAVKSLMLQNGADSVKISSLDDLLVLTKKADDTTAEVKPGKRRYSCVSNSRSFKVMCHDANPLLPEEMVYHLRRGLGSHGQVVHIEEITPRKPNYVEIPHLLSKDIKSALQHMGITRLFSHQADSIQASLEGKSVVVATKTSSGKSLCYNVPVLEILLHNPLACALYLFPTKALAQDQLRALLAITHGFDNSLNIGIYDGDTSQEDRLRLRDKARLLITNPDMLHVSILPSHRQFNRFLSNLKFIVIDEAHCYKGAFGCHVALIFRRLRRICSHVYGSDPSFVFSTATSANPKEHAMELANLSTVELIKNDGSPSGSKLFVLWNPPLKTALKIEDTSSSAKSSSRKDHIATRSSPILEVSCLFAEMVQHGLRCIAFCKTRKLCELVLCYTREILCETAPHLVDRVYSYRGGYIVEDRRRIEGEFFKGIICGIAATNALELGIDVGHIDVTLHLGFPGSIASLWQQAGRSGRRGNQSVAIYVAFEGPLDQYFMKFPTKLFNGPIECCHVDADNDQVLHQHLSCAAFEYPLSLLHDEKYFGQRFGTAVVNLKNKGILRTNLSCDLGSRTWTYIGEEKSPSVAVNIRAIETERYRVMELLKDEVLEEIEESKAFFQVYEGAVYMNQGKTYLVKHLDLSNKIAWCQQAGLNYYTKTRDYTDVHIMGDDIAYLAKMPGHHYSQTTAQTHACRVTTKWFGFHRILKKSNQIIDTVELSLPDYSYESQAAWIRVPQSAKISVESSCYSFRGGLHAAGHALLNVVPLYILCNQSDLASDCSNPHDSRNIPERILLYDPCPGGNGFSRKVQPLFTEMLTSALELLTSCHCSGDSGCPNCTQSLTCREYNEVLHKDAAIIIIKGVLDAEKSQLHS